MDKKSLNFHIKNDDYFGTLATVLDLVRQDILKNGYNKKYSDLIKKKVAELIFLQNHFNIIKK